MKFSRVCFFTFLFFFSFFPLSYGEVSINKIDGLVDWNKPENYAEAKRAVKLAKEINAEKRRRKQLRDAGVGEEDIKRIIRDERAGKVNQLGEKDLEKVNKNLQNDNKVVKGDDDADDDEDDDEVDDVRINDYSTNSNSRSTTTRSAFGTAKNNQNLVFGDNINGRYMPEEHYRQYNVGQYSGQRNNQYSGYNRQNDFVGSRYGDGYNNGNDNDIGVVGDGSRIGNFKNNSVLKTQGVESNASYLAMNEAKKTKEEFEKSIDASNTGDYEDWELSRILSKAGNNVNDREKFLMFAREAGRIANRREKTSNFMDIDMLNADISYEFDDEGGFSAKNGRSNTGRYARYGGGQRYASSNNMSESLSNVKNGSKSVYYAEGKSIVRGSRNKNGSEQKAKGLSSKFVVNEPARASSRFYASSRDEYKARVKDEGEKKYNVAIGKNTMTDKQIKAKSIGAPFPEMRENSNHKTQYLPQNIAQIAYDKNNRHLQPAVFEKDIISNAFDKLGDEDAIQIARALIDKFGNVDIADEDGNTLLMHAVARGNQSLVATLLAEGANPNALNNEGFAPIHLASSNGDNVAMYSIMMNNGNSNLRDKDGNTAFMYASKMCNADTIRLMISLGGDPSIENIATGKTAFDFVRENPDQVVITLLERKTENMFRKRKPVDLVK